MRCYATHDMSWPQIKECLHNLTLSICTQGYRLMLAQYTTKMQQINQHEMNSYDMHWPPAQCHVRNW